MNAAETADSRASSSATSARSRWPRLTWSAHAPGSWPDLHVTRDTRAQGLGVKAYAA